MDHFPLGVAPTITHSLIPPWFGYHQGWNYQPRKLVQVPRKKIATKKIANTFTSHIVYKEEFDLLETTARSDEQKKYSFPKLVSRKAINCHVSKIAPENRCWDHLDNRHGEKTNTNQNWLQQVGYSLLIYSNRQMSLNVCVRIERTVLLATSFISHNCILQVLQLFSYRCSLHKRNAC